MHFGRWLVTILLAMQGNAYALTLLRAECTRLRGMLSAAHRLVADQALTALVDAASIKPEDLAGDTQRQPIRALFDGQIHGVFPLLERSRIDKTFFWISRQSLAVSSSRSSLSICFCIFWIFF